MNEVVDEREGTIICSDCGLVISNFYLSQPQPQHINIPGFSSVQEEIKELLERLNLPQCFSEDIYNNIQSSKKDKYEKKRLNTIFCL
jgi:transcription initiation factor TFIIIB Brf1 subunit/transcription initiation factor TFIIB